MRFRLIVTSKGNGDSWAVYRDEGTPAAPGTVVREMGPLVRSVKTGEDLKKLMEEEGVSIADLAGVGLAEMLLAGV